MQPVDLSPRAALFSPFVPVVAIPSINVFCVRKNSTINGAITKTTSADVTSVRAQRDGRGFPEGVLALTWDDGPDVNTLALGEYLRPLSLDDSGLHASLEHRGWLPAP